ncbi:PREDICTED: translocase of chloroplast 159, chloroplastic-like isoform X2 [Lupinus angustifolius]|uniref:translocase of chloroplast 159, chloroplastic-like isoform X2 n=1 Tax=Lupinus angustifolius TaxID=3871 RepID=UPI00092F64E8|nr:PREDICTED: translocase of chloroplast 159, chloroplastic-like isoform X2 [Lupinus angustifolius]
MENNPSSPSIQSHFQTRNSMVVDNGSESDGFVSGEEEFETPMAYPDDKFAFGDTPFVNSLDFFTTFDDGESDFDGIVGGEENEVNNGSDEVHTRVYGTSNSDDTFRYTKPALGDGNGDFVEASSDGDDDKGLESGKFDGIIFVEENEVKVHDSVDVKKEVATEESNSSDEVDTRGAGDSVIETLHVDLLAPGVAVAGEKVEVEGSEIKGLEGKACGLSLDNEFDSLEQNAEEASDKLANGDTGGDQSVDTGADDNDSGHAEMRKESDIAIIQKDENSAFASDSVKSVQDDTNIEAHDDAEADQNVDIGADGDDSGHAEKGQESDIAIVQKDEDSELVSDKVKAVQDDINIEVNADEPLFASDTEKSVQDDTNVEAHAGEGETESHVKASGDSLTSEHVNPGSSWIRAMSPIEDEEGEHHPGVREIDVSVSVAEGEEKIVESSESAKQFSEHLEQQSAVGSNSGADTSQGLSRRIDGQIVTDSEEEGNTDDEGHNQLFDSDVLAALLKAGAGQDGGGITISSRDGSRLFSVESPAGLGTSLQSSKPASGLNRASSFTSSISRPVTNYAINLSEEDKKKLEKLQQIRIKFLRLVQRLGFTPEESIAAQVLFRLTTLAGRHTGQLFSSEAAMESAYQLEAERRDDLNFSLNILVLGKTGVGKSATINSIFGEMKTSISAYGPSTAAVTEIVGVVDGVKLRIFDTPGLKSSALEHGFNRKVLSVVKKVIKKSPPDIVLYVDRLDMQTRDLNDVPMLKLISSALGSSIWRNVVIALTHAASAPPDGSSGSPLSYDVFLAQRSTSVQQSIGQAAGEFRIMNPGLMNPVALVENHPSCRKNRHGHKVLPNGQSWRPLLLLLCYAIKILSEASNVSKTQESYDTNRLFGFRVRAPPLPYLLSLLLQHRAHPKLPSEQGGIDDSEFAIDLADLSDSDSDEEEYDQLLPFRPLKKAQVAKLTREQRNAYFEEYEYRIKLQQKKQWKEELRRMKEIREMKQKGKTGVNDYGDMEDDQENGSPAAVAVPLPDMTLPPTFDNDIPAYRYRFIEPTSQLLTRPVLVTQSWDHDCGYDGVNLEHSLAVVDKFPVAVTVQMTKDKKDFSIHLDYSAATKHGENGSSMASLNVQNIGKQIAYILGGETEFKNFKRNKTAAGLSVSFLGETISTGLKVEDQIVLGKRLALVGSTGIMRSKGDSVYGTNVEVRLREADFPIGQDQSSLSLSLVKWRGDLALGANFQSQFSVGRNYKMAIQATMNNKQSGQISVRTSSSDQLQIALLAILPIARAIYKNFWPKAAENHSIY